MSEEKTTKLPEGQEVITIGDGDNAKEFTVQLPSAMWQLERFDEYNENRSVENAKKLVNTLFSNTITRPGGVTADSLPLPEDQEVGVGGLQFRLHHPGVAWYVWASIEFLGEGRGSKRGAFIQAMVDAGVISGINGASVDKLTNIMQLQQLANEATKHIESAPAWELYFRLFFRPS